MSYVKDMSSIGKGVTFSVRLPKATADAFDRISQLMQINKSDFLRVCVEKLCRDNKLYLDHVDKVQQYISFIKTKMSRIPTEKIIIENGSWETASEVAILMLCDLMFVWSEKIFNLWFSIMKEYGLAKEGDKSKWRETFSNGLVLIEDIGFLLSPTRIATDVEELIKNEFWWDELEIKKISLLLAVKRAIEKYSAENLVDEIIKKASKEEQEPTVIIIDAKGRFKRSGSVIVTPAEIEKLSKIKRQNSKNL